LEKNNIKPSIINSFYAMMNDLKKVGFKRRDIILLLRDRTSPKMGIKDIENVLDAIIQFEKDFMNFKGILNSQEEVI